MAYLKMGMSYNVVVMTLLRVLFKKGEMQTRMRYS